MPTDNRTSRSYKPMYAKHIESEKNCMTDQMQ